MVHVLESGFCFYIHDTHQRKAYAHIHLGISSDQWDILHPKVHTVNTNELVELEKKANESLKKWSCVWCLSFNQLPLGKIDIVRFYSLNSNGFIFHNANVIYFLIQPHKSPFFKFYFNHKKINVLKPGSGVWQV